MKETAVVAKGVAVSLDLSVGHLSSFSVEAEEGRVLRPLHRAPWVDDHAEDFPAATPANVRRLSGDFFCAPFGLNDVEPAPSHGWPANSPWGHIDTIDRTDGQTALFRLERTVMGATLEKELAVRDGHPFVYQRHRFTGGSGAVSLSHHVMTRISGAAAIAYSAKAFAETPPVALEPDPARGRSVFAYPATAGPERFPLKDGGVVDLGRWPYGAAHEDFAVLAEEPGNRLGWTVVTREAEGDRLVIVKATAELPVTMLWVSNGGRDYAPWSGRHTGVLGIEDGRASPLGHADSIRDNAWTRRGIPTSAVLGHAPIVVSHAMGVVSSDPKEGNVVDVSFEERALVLHFSSGRTRAVPFDQRWFEGQ